MLSKRTWGLELEFQQLGPQFSNELFAANLIDSSWEVHDDGSCRGKSYSISNGDFLYYPATQADGTVYEHPLITAAREREQRSSRGFGYELVSPVLQSAAAWEFANRASIFLKHVKYFERSSIHIHVGVRNTPWRTIQRYFLWFYCLEAAIYRISAGGRMHRGMSMFFDPTTSERKRHDHNYARPLSSPIGIRSSSRSDRFVPLVNVDALLTARTATQFTQAWGNIASYWGGPMPAQWHPWRLMGLNLASVNQRGTLEWRVFNATYSQLPHFLKLVDGIMLAAEKGDPPTELLAEPMILGSTHIGEEEQLAIINELCDHEFDSCWGMYPVAPCVTEALPSHYDRGGRAFYIPESIDRIINNVRVRDTGTDTYPLYV